MKIENVDINSLRLMEGNPRRMSPAGKLKLRESLKEFGYVQLLIVNKDNTVVGGNQKLELLKELGYTNIDIIRVDLTENKAKLLNIALNKISAEWDDGKLREMLGVIDNENLLLSGFDDLEINKLLGITPEDKEPSEQNLPETSRMKEGEIWLLGKHRLMCGDATKEEDVRKLVGDKKIDMVFTDSPYGVDYKHKNHVNSSYEHCVIVPFPTTTLWICSGEAVQPS